VKRKIEASTVVSHVPSKDSVRLHEPVYLKGDTKQESQDMAVKKTDIALKFWSRVDEPVCDRFVRRGSRVLCLAWRR
jgi:hypothetical protein